MRIVEILPRPDPSERRELLDLADAVSDATGAPALSDHLRLDLGTGGAPGFVAVRVRDEHATLAFAQVSAANAGSALEVVVRPELPDADRVHDDAAETAVDAFRRIGGGRLTWWLDEPGERRRALAEQLGLAPVRVLFEMRRSLPLDRHATIETRAFVPGSDDAAWVEVNNRAFAEHGEQGGWTVETLAHRVQEPWFDADGFRILERDGRIAGFCWTKLHTDEDPVVGEIYAIAVDPSLHGEGLGRELTLAGLDSIAARGVTVANLYVDADNTAAVRLYERLGFTVHRSRTAFGGELDAVPPAAGSDA